MLHKRISLVFLILLLFSNAYSAYLKNVPQKITQPNGVVIHCFASGDEYHNWLHDSAGFTIIQHPETGYYTYAVLSEDKLIPSEYVVGTIDPASTGLRTDINISAQSWMEKRKVFEHGHNNARTHKKITKNEGTMNNLAFFISFADDTTGYIESFSHLSGMYNDNHDTSNSLYNYYRIVSYGKMFIKTHFYPAPDGDVVLSYKDTLPRNHYRPKSATNEIGYTGDGERREREWGLLRRTVQFLTDSIPSNLNLDFNEDGRVDNICFIVTGNVDGWSDLLWPHRWALDTSTTKLRINNRTVYDYNFLIETYSVPGVITHEMMHTLSAPDLYRYYNPYRIDPVGRWCLMAETNYSSPQGMSAYIKHQYGGWIDSIPEITSPGTYTLYPVNGTSPEKTAYMIRPNSMYNEYLVLEYRKTNSIIFERSLPGSGLVIYRIDANFTGKGSIYYDGEHELDEVYVFRPNGSPTSNGNLYRAHFAWDYGRTTFGLLTDPAPFYSSGYSMKDVLITDITEVGDSIQFTLRQQIDTLAFNTNEIILDCASGAKSSFSIASNTAWEIANTCSSWLNMDIKAGKGSATITVNSLSENKNSTSRVCSLNVYMLNDNAKRILINQSSCTGIEESSQNAVLKIFPSPASEYITVSYPEIDEVSTISIYSIKGQLLYSSPLKGENHETIVNISGFSPGIYYLKFHSQKQSVVKPFTVK